MLLLPQLFMAVGQETIGSFEIAYYCAMPRNKKFLNNAAAS